MQILKSCGKGLCNDCAIEVTRGLACSAECEKDAIESNSAACNTVIFDWNGVPSSTAFI